MWLLNKKKILVNISFLLILIFIFSGCSSNQEAISIVKNGHFNNHKEKTVGKAIEDFFGNPKWTSGVAEDGTNFVNVEGTILYHEKEVEAVLQFKVDLEERTFQVNALELNEIPQNKLIIGALIKKMYDK